MFLGSEKKSRACWPFAARFFPLSTSFFDLLNIRMGLPTHAQERLVFDSDMLHNHIASSQKASWNHNILDAPCEPCHEETLGGASK
jgi:hypothetical protein